MTKPTYPRYYRNGQSYKLTEEEIRQIKKYHEDGKTNYWIAKKFKISAPAVRYHIYPAVKEANNKRTLERYNKLTKKEKAARKMKEYYGKLERIGQQYLVYLNESRKNFPSYQSYYRKYFKMLSRREQKIVEQYYQVIRPKLKKFG